MSKGTGVLFLDVSYFSPGEFIWLLNWEVATFLVLDLDVNILNGIEEPLLLL